MIFLTGDVHHLGRAMGDQRKSGGMSEVQLCELYLEIANKHSVCPTLFFTGLAVETEGETILSLMNRYRFEIGGHTYSANRQRYFLALSRRTLGLANGPYWFQKRDMLATITCIRERLGVSIVSWRNHAYRMDLNTYTIASEMGIRQVSNRVTDVDGNTREIEGIVEVPINTMPDHESLGHDDHPRRFSIERWLDKVLEQIRYQQKLNLPSVILAHPLCMFIEDRMHALEQLCREIGKYQNGSLMECKCSPNVCVG